MKKLYQLSFCIVLIMISSCSDFLDEIPDQKLAVPRSLTDLQGLMDDYLNLLPDPGMGEISADDYYLTDADWKGLANEGHRRAYVWEKDYLYGTGTSSDWLTAYRIIYYSNIVFENILNVERTVLNQAQWNNVKGQALFHRGRSLLALSQIWTKVYNPATASTDLGLPLRLDTDYNIPSVRASLKETYETIIHDLQEAIPLLPVEALHPTRPSRLAALALLARAHLFMGEYDKCFQYSDQFLKLKSDLLDFNTLSAAANFPLPEFNKEVIFASYLTTPAPLNISRAKVDSTLYKSYVNGDLRKTIFFRDNKNGSFGFRGSNMGNLAPYSGVAVDEIYLMRAECQARAGNTSAALGDLNTLLKSRWNKNVVFTALTAVNASEALKLILTERRKELLMRGLRWSDLKRLNRDGAGITLTRKINNAVYTLPPNDLRYALPFPEDVIALTGMPQNPR